MCPMGPIVLVRVLHRRTSGVLLHGEHLLPQRGGKQERRAHYQAADSEPCHLGPREDVRNVGWEGGLCVCLVALLR